MKKKDNNNEELISIFEEKTNNEKTEMISLASRCPELFEIGSIELSEELEEKMKLLIDISSKKRKRTKQ